MRGLILTIQSSSQSSVREPCAAANFFIDNIFHFGASPSASSDAALIMELSSIFYGILTAGNFYLKSYYKHFS